MKSTNSAFSDYNFLFENIDQTLQTNTQLMMEELLQQAIPAAQRQPEGVASTHLVRNATISMNDVEGGVSRVENAGSYRPVTLGEEPEDITEDEIISIEDTYRETAAAGLINSQSA